MKWQGNSDKHVFNEWLENATSSEMKDYIKEKTEKKDIPVWLALFYFVGVIFFAVTFAFGIVWEANQISGINYQHSGFTLNTMQGKVIDNQATELCALHNYGDFVSSGINYDGSYSVYCTEHTINYGESK